MRIFSIIGVLAFAIATAGLAQAGPIIFDGGVPSVLHAGNETTLWVQANDLVLSADGLVADGHFWTFESGTSWDGTLDYYFFADNGGQPGAPINSGSGVNIQRATTGVIANRPGFAFHGFPEYEYSFDLATPLGLAGGTRYWFGIHLASGFPLDQIYWRTTDSGFGAPAYESFGGTFNNWVDSAVNRDHAFNL
ncbi:MAG: choice-of-anchor R domain-containing protein, partial [Planctomycetota bacterium]